MLRKNNEEAKQANEAAQHSALLTISVRLGAASLVSKINYGLDLHSLWSCRRMFLHVTECCAFYLEFQIVRHFYAGHDGYGECCKAAVFCELIQSWMEEKDHRTDRGTTFE
jgi:hypothetical protein